jgi:hypothetical protein
MSRIFFSNGDGIHLPLVEQNKIRQMKTYQECVQEYDEKIPHRSDAYMLGFLDTIAFIFNKSRIQVSKDIQDYRAKRYHEEEET